MFGGRWWDAATGKPSANDPGNVAAWTLMSNFYRKFGAEKISTFTSEQVSNPLGSQFIAGKAAMAYDGDWITACARVYNPELRWSLFPLPPAEGHDDAAYSTPVDGAIYVVPTGSKHVAESWEVVRWMGTSHEASCVIQKALANASPLRKVGEDADCLPNPEYKVFTDIMSHDKMYVWPPIAVSAFYANERNALADAVNFGKMSPQEALDELQRKVEEELKKVEG
jgi:multiple sugar transport system substrate-binding protein